jgi:hypothetical protein
LTSFAAAAISLTCESAVAAPTPAAALSFETALRASSGRGRQVLQQPPACARVAGNAKRPLGFPAGAIPTVDFLLHDLDVVVKKMRVKTHDRRASDAA